MRTADDRRKTGRFLGVPYDWRRTGYLSRLRLSWWNPSEPRFVVPRAFGWGYAFNLARLLRRKPTHRAATRNP